jgi:hypothetical protein
MEGGDFELGHIEPLTEHVHADNDSGFTRKQLFRRGLASFC